MLRTLAVPVLAVWAIAGASAWSARPVAGEAVVMLDEVTLRSADTAGAVPALGTRYAIRDTRYAIRDTRDRRVLSDIVQHCEGENIA